MGVDRIYMDNAAATMTDPEVIEAMMPYFTQSYAVASSEFSHTPGILAREGLDSAREIIATKLNCAPQEIVFTSGGTESCNLAVKGAAWAQKEKKDHILCSPTEYNAVIRSCQWLEQRGFKVTYLDVDEEGFIDPGDVKKAITDRTFLVNVQHANQEVGTIQPVEEIGRICSEQGVLFHTDAALSFTQLDVDVEQFQADFVTLSAHKIHGPKGIGALYVREGTKLEKLFHGGYMESDRRAGTENVTGAVGFGKAVQLATPTHTQTIRDLQQSFLDRLKDRIEDFRINGPEDLSKRLPANLNVSFALVEGESVVLHMDMKGISVITGSACFSRSLEPSYVMMAMGYTHERAHGSIRFTYSRFNKPDEIERVVDGCAEIITNLRKISPLK